MVQLHSLREFPGYADVLPTTADCYSTFEAPLDNGVLTTDRSNSLLLPLSSFSTPKSRSNTF